MSEWKPIETAPKDGTEILVWHDHESDPYFAEKKGTLTLYGGWCEGTVAEYSKGQYIAVWGGGHTDCWEDGGGSMPDWWFKHGSEFERPLAPTHWMPLPPPPKAGEEGK